MATGKRATVSNGMGCMSTRAKTTKRLSEQEIDQIVTAEAHDDAAWENRLSYEEPRPPHFRFRRISPRAALFWRSCIAPRVSKNG